MRIPNALLLIGLALGLALSTSPDAFAGPPPAQHFKVVSFRQVHGSEAYPFDSSCVVVAENEKTRVTGLLTTGFAGGTGSCFPIAIGDRATIKNPDDVTFWINNRPYTIQSAAALK